MASGWTNKLRYRALQWVFLAGTRPTNYYLALVTSATTPTADTNTKSELTEVANGNGYTTGGYSLTPGATDFDTLTEDDSNDRALVQLKDIVFTASGGALPASGSGARYAILTDDNATQGSREVLTFWDLTSDRSVSSGQALTLADAEMRIS